MLFFYYDESSPPEGRTWRVKQETVDRDCVEMEDGLFDSLSVIHGDFFIPLTFYCTGRAD